MVGSGAVDGRDTGYGGREGAVRERDHTIRNYRLHRSQSRRPNRGRCTIDVGNTAGVLDNLLSYRGGEQARHAQEAARKHEDTRRLQHVSNDTWHWGEHTLP